VAAVTSTADLVDRYGERAAVCAVEMRLFGSRRAFEGELATVRCHEDNVLVKRTLGDPGRGRVLVVDGGGSRRVALAGDVVAGIAAEHGWAGLVIHGCVRDVAALRELDIGVAALGSTPRPSGKTGAGEVDVSITFGGVTFRPGALVCVDEDGIVVVDASS
jgi:regulator of ribonuclease activity A